MQYFHICGTRITAGPTELPVQWVDPITGTTHGLQSMSGQELIDIGWLPLIPSNVVIRDPFDAVATQEYVINGDQVDEVVVLEVLSLGDVITQKARVISTFHDEWMSGTFTWDTMPWDGGEKSRQNITGMTSAIANGVPIPADFTWVNADLTAVPMSPADLVAMGATMLNWVNTGYQTKYYHVTQIMGMSDIDQIIAYDHTLGWPM